MKRTEVESSNISAIGYDEKDETLEIEFRRSKAVYQYKDVPLPIYEELMEAESHGAFFNEHIAKNFEYVRL